MRRKTVNPCGVAGDSDWAWKESDGSGVAVFSEGDRLFDAMLADIAAAQDRVWLESYIFATDQVGQRFVDCLGERAAHGVDVQVRVDAVGSHFGFSGAVARRLGGSGARLRWWRPLAWRTLRTFHRRNHRKLLVVDRRAAYLGGFNISDVSSRRASGDARWRDTHVRLSGPVVDQAAAAFAAFGRGEADWRGDETAPLFIVSNHGRRCRKRWRALLRQAFHGARERVWLTTPYFVPDSAIQRQLCGAAMRGVDVRVMVPGKSDVRLVQWAGRASYAQLLAAGVRVFEYLPRTLHAKTLVVDDGWATIGTANFDYRSFFINYELNLVGRSRRLATALACLFENDMELSREVLEPLWSARPLQGRLSELIGWSARRWL